MLFFLVYILFVIICPNNVANVLIYFSQVLMLPSYGTILVYTGQISLISDRDHNRYTKQIPEIAFIYFNCLFV